MTHQRGFTLIEALLTSIVVGIGLTGVLLIFQGFTTGQILTDQTLTATNLAHEKMEQIIADRIASGYSTVRTNGGSFYSDGALSGDFAGYTRNVTFQDINPPPIASPTPFTTDGTDDFNSTATTDTGYLRVTINMSWNNGSDAIKVTTLITDGVP